VSDSAPLAWRRARAGLGNGRRLAGWRARAAPSPASPRRTHRHSRVAQSAGDLGGWLDRRVRGRNTRQARVRARSSVSSDAVDRRRSGDRVVRYALRLWAIGTLGRYFKPIVHLQQDHHVVRSGPYKVLRHPAYTGLLLALFGISLTFANIASIAVFNCCIVAAILYRIRVEERTLLDGLGDEYAEYRRHTRRLIPGVW